MFGKLLRLLAAFLSWIFNLVFFPVVERCYGSKIVFNCAWEDPRCDLEALELEEGKDSVMVITSAGCNVLSYAINGAKHVYAIDKNPCQNALLALKIAAIKEFSYSEFWQLFGKGRMEKFSTLHYPRLRAHLSKESRDFWDKHAHYFNGKGLRPSFYFRGCSGFLAWLVGGYLRIIPGLHRAVLDLLEARTVEEQREIYFSRIEKKMWNRLLMWFLGNSVTLALLNGVPDAQRDLLEQEGGHASIADFIKNNLEFIMTQLPIKDNYFYRVYLTGEYTKDCCPEYLTKEGFEKLKAGAIDNVSYHTETIEEFLVSHKKKDITRFILLDHMDWMSTNPVPLRKEWQAILDNAPENTRVLYRSASETAEFVGDTEVKFNGKDQTVRDVLNYNPSVASKLHVLDRVHTYAGFFVADLRA
jgi:S-adenosylmethionine-diacylglycerol 3-amino-3-carboxypropyl transferase